MPNTYEPQPTCYRFDSLAAGDSYPPITLRVAVADNAQSSVSNEATVAGGGTAGPASGSDATSVSQLPQLTVSSFDSAGGVPYAPFSPGGSAAAGHVSPDGGQQRLRGHHRYRHVYGRSAGGAAAAGHGRLGLVLRRCDNLLQHGPGVTLSAGQQDAITLTVAVARDAPPSLQTFMQASGGGEIPAAGLDENNDYSTVANGGAYVDPTYVRPAG